MARGYQSLGSVSQSCFSWVAACWAEAVARALPHPRRPKLRNATTLVERNMAGNGESKSTGAIEEVNARWKWLMPNNLQGRGQEPGRKLTLLPGAADLATAP